jgi:cell wall-active antibiotic response 4TMS protein YvqF
VSEPILATDAERDTALALQRATLSSLRREGHWRLAPRTRFSAVLGSVTLDLWQAVLAGPEIEIEARAILGSVEVIVPEDVEVAVSGGGILSGEDLRIEGTPPARAPLVRIRHSGLMGSLTVRSRPRLTDEIKAQLRRYL